MEQFFNEVGASKRNHFWLDSIILIVFIRLDQEQKNGSRSNYLGATLLPGDILNFQIGLENARYLRLNTFIATILIM